MVILTPRQSALFTFQGRRVNWIRGRTTIEEGHPILVGREHMVEPLKIDFPAPVTQTAARPAKVDPGTLKPRGKTEAKKTA